ncbi:outer membrane protein with beta-barrel domain [Sphingobacterium allocomposti]|uniref:Outer membrane protein with beta-barrel domain n=1 Tax=Sphingobacterium allocomposti TaxID=415956 RepID=A0A5S5DUC9_9SPHI|nr:porin family protein [Sphingobacterium composti Yoo et al. 2007 non Ten et al. 2007]TYP98452.1 outer membrane protein with beta-barrel domain [Sphingobacterium composti Yoo et al. 2007 non Ten et al. 2007]
MEKLLEQPFFFENFRSIIPQKGASQHFSFTPARIGFFKFIFVFLFGLSVLPANAQYYYGDKNMSLGLTFNPNIGWLSYEDRDTYHPSAKIGYSYGLLADLGFARNYFFSTGLFINTLYSGAYGAYPGDDILMEKVYRLQYAEVPLTIKLKTNQGYRGRFYGQFGLTAGVKVSGKERYEGNPNYTPIAGDDVFRLGLQIGTGAEWRLAGNLSAQTGITYNNGFTRTMSAGSPRLSYLSFNIGLLF